MVRMGGVVVFNHLVLGILGSNGYQFLSCFGEVIQILNGICILFADSHANDTGGNVILRENIFLFPGRCLPGAFGTDVVLA